jgi:hypothetical protein
MEIIFKIAITSFSLTGLDPPGPSLCGVLIIHSSVKKLKTKKGDVMSVLYEDDDYYEICCDVSGNKREKNIGNQSKNFMFKEN